MRAAAPATCGDLAHLARPLGPWDPAALFEAFAGHGPACLLESGLAGATGRWSVVVPEAAAVLAAKGCSVTFAGPGDPVARPLAGEPLHLVRRLLRQRARPPVAGLPPFQCGLVGMVGYELVRQWERLPATTVDDTGLPELYLLVADRCLVVDHDAGRLWALARGPEAERWVAEAGERLAAGPGPRPRPEPLRLAAPPRSHWSPAAYEARVARILDYIRAGDIFQANLSHRFQAPVAGGTPWGLYRRLREINPAPFGGYLAGEGFAVVSNSPERLLRVADRWVESRPIAGTFPRPRAAAELAAAARALRAHPKERAEHLMLVDLIRNDLGRVCLYGSVEVDELLVTESYSHVVHLVSNVRGRLHPKRDRIDCLRACFPGGTITGVPKVRCMEILDELEPYARGPYTGSLLYLSDAGAMDANILIRTAVVTGGRCLFHVGGGIVADSDPAREYRETLHKAAALEAALAGE
ncbi:MAG: anthranilate synthase component I family protein [Nitrospirae bacterium]|nr:MAG: anthranilate synthase component I family protein [Nitrospirota bacterium]